MGAATGAPTSGETFTPHKAEDAEDGRVQVKEEGGDDEPGPGPHDKHLKEAREKLGHEVEEGPINLNEKADTQDRWSDSTTTPIKLTPTLQELPDVPFSQQEQEVQRDDPAAPRIQEGLRHHETDAGHEQPEPQPNERNLRTEERENPSVKLLTQI